MNKILLVLGPTAVGKTAFSISLAKKLKTEIISADSMQIYRHMDIGTAKPSPAERSAAAHHMIDIVEPYQAFSTGLYMEMARPIIERLLSEGKVPIITGGTGLYMKAMTRGIFEGPSADKALRKKLLQEEMESQGSLFMRLSEIDPTAAERIDPHDHRRLLRALEVCLRTGATMTEMQQQRTKPLPYEFIKIGLTCQRERLYEKINNRVDEMINQGLIEEVRDLIEIILFHCPPSDSISPIEHLLSFTSMQAIGYKETAMYLYGLSDREGAVSLIKQRTRNYAKRQFTWFKKEHGIQWIDAETCVSGAFIPEDLLTP